MSNIVQVADFANMVHMSNMADMANMADITDIADMADMSEIVSCNVRNAYSIHDSIADSAQTEYCTTFHCSFVRVSVRAFVTGVTSHISHIYKGINAMLIIRDPSTPIYSESKSSWLSF